MATLVSNPDLFRGYFIKIKNILLRLLTDCNDLVGMFARVTKLFVVDLYIDRVILFRITFVDQVMNCDN